MPLRCLSDCPSRCRSSTPPLHRRALGRVAKMSPRYRSVSRSQHVSGVAANKLALESGYESPRGALAAWCGALEPRGNRHTHTRRRVLDRLSSRGVHRALIWPSSAPSILGSLCAPRSTVPGGAIRQLTIARPCHVDSTDRARLRRFYCFFWAPRAMTVQPPRPPDAFKCRSEPP